MASKKNPRRCSIDLAALVALPESHPLAKVGEAARWCVRSALVDPNYTRAASALGITYRSLVRVRRAMGYETGCIATDTRVIAKSASKPVIDKKPGRLDHGIR